MSEADIKRAAIYLRISQERKSSKSYGKDAISRQREDCEANCRYRGWEVIKTYVDEGVSAYSGVERPAYQEMLKDYKDGKFEVIVAWKLDRLSRNAGTFPEMLKEIPNVRICAGDIGLLDLTTPDGRFLANNFANIAEFESGRKGDRERRSNLQHAMMGNPKKGSQRCFGYTRDREIIEPEAELIRILYQDRIEGYPVRDLLRALNHEPTRNDMPKLKKAVENAGITEPWSRTRLNYLLVNPKYAGFVALVSEPEGSGPRRRRNAAVLENILTDENGKEIRGQWQPIVDEDVWRQSVAITKKNQYGDRTTNVPRYLGSGIYRCAVCGKPLYVGSGSYRCLEKGHVCRRQEPIDDLVIATMRARLEQDDYKNLLVKDDKGRIHEIDHEIDKCDLKLKNYKLDYKNEYLTGAEYQEFRNEEQAKKDKLLSERASLLAVPTDGLLKADNPVEAFDRIKDDVVRMRKIVGYFMDVTIEPHHRGTPRGQRTFTFDGINITWKH